MKKWPGMAHLGKIRNEWEELAAILRRNFEKSAYW